MPNYNDNLGYISHHSHRRRTPKYPIFILVVLIVLVAVILASGKGALKLPFMKTGTAAAAVSSVQATTAAPETTTEDASETLLAQAGIKAEQYDYDGAIELIKGNSSVSGSPDGQAAIASYSDAKGKCVRQDIHKITHVFFHTLIMNTDKAFSATGQSQKQVDGYNEVMTTKSEFEKILQAMYDRGYVLVDIRDIAYETDDKEKGGKKMVEGDIMLPPGKKAFVLSQDDVCYYEYMTGHGFAKDLIVGPDGKPKNEMVMDDGSISVGSYDVVPIVDDFVEKHPDFSYRGSKGIVAVTGYNGVFGYRTDDAYIGKNPNIDQDKETVKKVAKCLRDDGWEIASHSWGHRYYGKISMDDLKTDNEKWQKRVGSLIGGTDILIFAFGNDIGDWHPYKDSNERYQYLMSTGFRYFCNVDSNQYYVQMGGDYLRQGRRNLDGQRMWTDLSQPDKARLSDLFDVKSVFDKARPTPVPTE